MILVTVGSSEFPFDRLLRVLDRMPGNEALVVQHGPSAIRPAGAHCVPFLPLEELTELVRAARLVVTHAGVGSILLSLANDKRPYVVPRRRAFGETVDDHQVESARQFARAGLISLVEEPEQLAAAVLDPREEPVARLVGGGPLERDLRDYLDSVIAGPRVLEPA